METPVAVDVKMNTSHLYLPSLPVPAVVGIAMRGFKGPGGGIPEDVLMIINCFLSYLFQ